MEQLLKNAVQNMCWMADTIHQAHHDTVPETNGDFITWKTCTKGVCGSIEHMLAQAGFDKDLNPIPVRP